MDAMEIASLLEVFSLSKPTTAEYADELLVHAGRGLNDSQQKRGN